MSAGNDHSLMVRLLAVTLSVVACAVAVIWLAIDTLAAGYFVTLMEKYHISPEPAHAMFVAAVHRYLLWALAGAAILAASLSYLLFRRLLAPLKRMTVIARDIAAGNFSGRVPTARRDEIGQLAQAFNRMAESLEKLEKLRRDLMIDVAHELRTPLTNMRGYLEALGDGVVSPSPQTIGLLQNETLRLAALVEDVLQLARADAARGHLQPEAVDLERLVRAALEAFKPALDAVNLTVRIHAPPEPPVIPADRQAMERVLRNLMDNLARYAPAGSQAQIRLFSEPDEVGVVFENEAHGLAVETLPHLFERFYRGEPSRSRLLGGAGIGLSIVKELVEAHGGRVNARKLDSRLGIEIRLPRHRPIPANP